MTCQPMNMPLCRGGLCAARPNQGNSIASSRSHMAFASGFEHTYMMRTCHRCTVAEMASFAVSQLGRSCLGCAAQITSFAAKEPGGMTDCPQHAARTRQEFLEEKGSLGRNYPGKLSSGGSILSLIMIAAPIHKQITSRGLEGKPVRAA